jgi:hypothetical protein
MALAFGIAAQMDSAQRGPCGAAKVRAPPSESVKFVQFVASVFRRLPRFLRFSVVNCWFHKLFHTFSDITNYSVTLSPSSV